jgi:hypothetical protein
LQYLRFITRERPNASAINKTKLGLNEKQLAFGRLNRM